MALALLKTTDRKELLHPDYADQWKIYFNYDFTIGEIDPCWLIDLNATGRMAITIAETESLMEDVFIWDECAVTDDHILPDITAQRSFLRWRSRF